MGILPAHSTHGLNKWCEQHGWEAVQAIEEGLCCPNVSWELSMPMACLVKVAAMKRNPKGNFKNYVCLALAVKSCL